MNLRISVIMPVYNCEAYVGEAIDSILQQTCRNFEFLIMDDGSTDSTSAILSDYARRDDRIHVFKQSNQGLPISLNRLMNSASGEYLARMDADDISLPERFERQVTFLDTHPEVGVCGTAIEMFSESTSATMFFMERDEMLKAFLPFTTPFAHPSLMIRRKLFLEYGLNYDTSFHYAEDYDLWARAAPFTRFTVLQQVLLRYRVHPGQTLNRSMETKLQDIRRIWKQQLINLGIDPTDDDLRVHQIVADPLIGNPLVALDRAALTEVQYWLVRLWRANASRRIFDQSAFTRVLTYRWLKSCQVSGAAGLWALARFLLSPISNPLRITAFVHQRLR